MMSGIWSHLGDSPTYDCKGLKGQNPKLCRCCDTKLNLHAKSALCLHHAAVYCCNYKVAAYMGNSFREQLCQIHKYLSSHNPQPHSCHY